MEYESSTPWWQETELSDFDGPQEDSNNDMWLFLKNCILTIMKLVICALVLANNALLTFAILKFKTLQTKTNSIIVNFAVVNSAVTISSTVASVIIAIQYMTNEYLPMIHTVTVLLLLFLQITYILAALLSLDWFIAANFKSFDSKYQKIYKWVIGLCYVLPLLYILPGFVAGYHYFNLLEMFVHVTYWGGFTIILIVNVAKYCNTYNEEALKFSHGVTVSNIYFLMWLPTLITITGDKMFSVSEDISFELLSFIMQCLITVALLAPIVMTLGLIIGDRHFKMSYCAIFGCSVSDYPPTDNKTEEENGC